MTQATPKDYWISPSALHIELNALSDPDYIQASCVNGAQILVYVKDIIGYDAGHNYRRWPLQAAPTVFNTHAEKHVYAAIPRDMTLAASAWIVFPSEVIDIYGKNEKEEQIGDEKYYYINLQGVITSSGDNGTVQRDWKKDGRIVYGYLSSDEAISAVGSETEWYNYSSVDGIVTLLKDLTMKEGTKFRKLFANFLNVMPNGSLSFVGQGALTGIADPLSTPDTSTDKIVTPDFVRNRAISKLHNDTAEGLITFRKGLEVGNYKSGAQGGVIGSEGNAELLSVIVRKLISSANYRSGFTGEGWKIWLEDGLAKMELDELTVRRVTHFFEVLIEKVRSVGGQICVSSANGKIKTVEDVGDSYLITFEQPNSYLIGDYMRCATYSNGNEQHGYWVEISESQLGTKENPGYVVVPKREFDGWAGITEVGDETVLMGSKNKLRQNLILISATEDGQPRIDVMNGIGEKYFNNCLRTRLGNLDGIQDSWFPPDNQPHGDGLYADNAYLRGTFLLSTGEDIKTKFGIMEGLIRSSIEGVRNDFMQDKGFLNNPTFYDGLNHWTTQNDTVFFLFGNKWIWANNNLLSRKGDSASIVLDEGKRVVLIKNKSIVQKLSDYRSLPSIGTNSDGKKEPIAVYLSFFYKVRKKGTLTIEFKNVNNEGFIEYEPFKYEKELDSTDTYQQFTMSGLWNGTGDFSLSFSGEIYVYMLVLSEDEIESLTYKYRTLFEQSEKLVKIAAMNFDKDGNVLESSQIITTAKYNELISQRFDENGSLKNTAGLVTSTDWDTWLTKYAKDMDKKMDIESFAVMFATAVDEDSNIVKKADVSAFVTKDENGNIESGVHIGADNIELEGIVTANGNFKILEDGSIEAINGKFKGEINSDKGTIGGFTIGAGRIGSEATQSGEGGSLSIYNNFFRVGGDDGYVMFGNDVMPVTMGGAFTATGRIVNEHPNIHGDYGMDQSNYGLFIQVSGGTKNYGIWSSAALMAPSFVTTKAQLLTFDPNAITYSVDFSQANVILMYYREENSSGMTITLPAEDTVARQFGLRKLPDDFATIVTFRVRPGSLAITLVGIYNHNEDLVDYMLAAGDSVTVLISKVDGFRYQILNHSY